MLKTKPRNQQIRLYPLSSLQEFDEEFDELNRRRLQKISANLLISFEKRKDERHENAIFI